MNESDVGASTALTLQNEGTSVYVTPSGAVYDGPVTVVAAVTVVPVSARLTTRFSHVPANEGSAIATHAASAATQRIFMACLLSMQETRVLTGPHPDGAVPPQ